MCIQSQKESYYYKYKELITHLTSKYVFKTKLSKENNLSIEIYEK